MAQSLLKMADVAQQKLCPSFSDLFQLKFSSLDSNTNLSLDYTNFIYFPGYTLFYSTMPLCNKSEIKYILHNPLISQR